jgi:hypothetical protein
MCETFEAK